MTQLCPSPPHLLAPYTHETPTSSKKQMNRSGSVPVKLSNICNQYSPDLWQNSKPTTMHRKHVRPGERLYIILLYSNMCHSQWVGKLSGTKMNDVPEKNILRSFRLMLAIAATEQLLVKTMSKNWPVSISFRSGINFWSCRELSTPSSMPNILPRPRDNNMEKNNTDHSGDRGILRMASVKAMNVRPGPWKDWTRKINQDQCWCCFSSLINQESICWARGWC